MTRADFLQAFEVVLQIVKDHKELSARELEAIHQAFGIFKDKLSQDAGDVHNELSTKVSAALDTISKKHKVIQAQHTRRMNQLDGKLQDIEYARSVDTDAILDEVLARIVLPEQKEILLDTPISLRDKLHSLEGDDRIDFSAIKNVPDFSGKPNHGPVFTPTALYSLSDVSIAGITSGQSIKWDGVRWVAFTPSSTSATYTETLTDSGDHQTFTSLHTINTIYTLATINGQYISKTLYTISGSSIILTAPDANLAAVGIEIIYA
ncbi:MAG: hypothetical protein KGL39_32895 [Patescibacteria group bacterium]|nr:hypothetical protein [Patescibacteria group bacterium]